MHFSSLPRGFRLVFGRILLWVSLPALGCMLGAFSFFAFATRSSPAPTVRTCEPSSPARRKRRNDRFAQLRADFYPRDTSHETVRCRQNIINLCESLPRGAPLRRPTFLRSLSGKSRLAVAPRHAFSRLRAAFLRPALGENPALRSFQFPELPLFALSPFLRAFLTNQLTRTPSTRRTLAPPRVFARNAYSLTSRGRNLGALIATAITITWG